MSGRGPHRRGFALITALSIMVIMGVLAFTFRGAMELNAATVEADVLSVQARYLAAAGVAEARARIAQGRDVRALQEPHPVGTGTVTVRIEDLGGKLHLNQAPADEIARLLGIDTDTVRRARPLASVYDAYAAFGLDPDQFALALAHTTVDGPGVLDLGLAPEPVLAVLDGLSPSLAQAIVRARRGPDGVAGTADDLALSTAQALARVPGLPAEVARALARRLGDTATGYRVVAEGRARGAAGAARTARIEALLVPDADRWRVAQWVEQPPAS